MKLIDNTISSIDKTASRPLRWRRNVDDPKLNALTIHIASIDFSETNISSRHDIESVGHMIGRSSWLRWLEIIGPLSDDQRIINQARMEVEMLRIGLKANNSIRSISFKRINYLGNAVMQQVTPFLESNASLDSISLTSAITASQLAILAGGLVNRQEPLSHIIFPLHGNEDDLESFFHPFLDHPEKTPKSISNLNNVGLRGSQEIAKWLNRAGCSIISIEIRYSTQIDDEAASVLAEAIKGNKTLTTLDIPKRDITTSGRHEQINIFAQIDQLILHAAKPMVFIPAKRAS